MDRQTDRQTAKQWTGNTDNTNKQTAQKQTD